MMKDYCMVRTYCLCAHLACNCSIYLSGFRCNFFVISAITGCISVTVMSYHQSLVTVDSIYYLYLQKCKRCCFQESICVFWECVSVSVWVSVCMHDMWSCSVIEPGLVMCMIFCTACPTCLYSSVFTYMWWSRLSTGLLRYLFCDWWIFMFQTCLLMAGFIRDRFVLVR